jgi:hypothetical protein
MQNPINFTSYGHPAPKRDRLITAVLNALGGEGFHCVGLIGLLSEAGAPKGVKHHRFPSGMSGQQLGLALEKAGVTPAFSSANLAALLVSVHEGALIQARVAGQVDTMQNTTDAIVDLIPLSIAPKL